MRRILTIYTLLILSLTATAQKKADAVGESKDTLTMVYDALVKVFASTPAAPKIERVTSTTEIQDSAKVRATSKLAWTLPNAGRMGKAKYKTDTSATLDDDDEGETKDTTLLTKRNRVRGAGDGGCKPYLNALDYTLNKRYKPSNEDVYGSGFLNNAWIEGGVSLSRTSAGVKGGAYETQASLDLGFGKHVSDKSALRVKVLGLIAPRPYDGGERRYRVGGKVDYLYDFSSHFNGYKSDRDVSLLAVGGLGLVSPLSNSSSGGKGAGFDGHVGLLGRLRAGMQAYIALEPFVGVESNTNAGNWKGFSFFYGANLNYTYYLQDRLSREKRRRLIESRELIDEVAPDSMLHSWKKPWFFEIAGGLNMIASRPKTLQPHNPTTLQPRWTLSFGQWLSTALAVRASVVNEKLIMKNEELLMKDEESPTYECVSNTACRLEALFNPFGLKKNYDRNLPYGGYLTAGVTSPSFDSNSGERDGWGCVVGLHGWLRLADGLQAFIAPGYESSFHDSARGGRGWSVQLGLTVTSKSIDLIDWTRAEESDYVEQKRKVVVGVEGGLSSVPFKNRDDRGLNFGYNGDVFAEYHLNGYHAMRIDARWTQNPCIRQEDGIVRKEREEDVKLSLGYMLNLSNAMSCINPEGRCFELSAFAGPTVCLPIRDGDVMWKPALTFHVGAKLQYNITERLAAHLTPTFYFLTKRMKSEDDPDAIYYGQAIAKNALFMETLSLGISVGL